MNYRGVHRKPARIDWNFNRPIIHAELHFAVYALMLFAVTVK